MREIKLSITKREPPTKKSAMWIMKILSLEKYQDLSQGHRKDEVTRENLRDKSERIVNFILCYVFKFTHLFLLNPFNHLLKGQSDPVEMQIS